MSVLALRELAKKSPVLAEKRSALPERRPEAPEWRLDLAGGCSLMADGRPVLALSEGREGRDIVNLCIKNKKAKAFGVTPFQLVVHSENSNIPIVCSYHEGQEHWGKLAGIVGAYNIGYSVSVHLYAKIYGYMSVVQLFRVTSK